MKKKLRIGDCLLAVMAILLVAVGVAFNAMAGLGNDPVGIFYDGIRAALGLNQEQLGLASNIVNISLLVFLWFAGRKYISIGTVIHFFVYGLFVDFGTFLYPKIFVADTLTVRIVASVIGCLILYIGVALFIVADMGTDSMLGFAMVVRDWLGWDFKKAKWLVDGSFTLLGFLLGGTLGVVTVATALCAGPMIQFNTGLLNRIIKKDKGE